MRNQMVYEWYCTTLHIIAKMPNLLCIYQMGGKLINCDELK
jgi:hypothetical protein